MAETFKFPFIQANLQEMNTYKRKANRLPREYYQGRLFLFVTICCANRGVVFDSTDMVHGHLKALKELLQKNCATLWAYCFMPDHVHFLIEGESGTDLLDLIKLYKQETGFQYKKRYRQTLWQKSWFDHILRRDEKIEQKIRYIFENPFRKGLVEDFRDYPFIGSNVEAVKEYLKHETKPEV